MPIDVQALGMGHRRFTTLGTLIGLAVLLAGCGSGSGRAESLPSVAASPADTPSPPATSPPATSPPATRLPPTTPAATTTTGLGPCSEATLSITADKTAYPAGQTVHVTATLRNASASMCTVASSAERGFTVAKAGNTIWRSGCSGIATAHTAVEPCAKFIVLLPLRPGQSQTRTQAWQQQADGADHQVEAGSYEIGETWAGLTATVSVSIS